MKITILTTAEATVFEEWVFEGDATVQEEDALDALDHPEEWGLTFVSVTDLSTENEHDREVLRVETTQ